MKKLAILITVLCISFVHIYAESLSDDLDFPFGSSDSGDAEDDKVAVPDYDAPETLLGGDFNISGFGGPYMLYSQLNGEDVYFAGGRGAAIINNFFIIGGGGAGLVYPGERDNFNNYQYDNDEKYLHFGYGGVLVGFNLFQKRMINISLTSLFGGGALYFSNSYCEDEEEFQESQKEFQMSSIDEFFVAEPTAMVHLNITRWFRIGGGVAYRYTKGIDSGGFTDEDFNNWSFICAADFGWF